MNFLCRFSKNTQIPNFVKIRQVETELFHADGRTDVTKLIVAFRSVTKAPKNVTYTIHMCGFGGLGVACWPLVPKFAGSNPAEAVGFLRAKKSSARLPSEGK